MNNLKILWLKHGQKTLATLLGSLAIVDLTGYRDSIVTFVGERGYAATRLLGAAAIVWRALQATKTIDAQVTQGASDSLAAANVSAPAANTAMTEAGVKPPPSPPAPPP